MGCMGSKEKAAPRPTNPLAQTDNNGPTQQPSTTPASKATNPDESRLHVDCMYSE